MKFIIKSSILCFFQKIFWVDDRIASKPSLVHFLETITKILVKERKRKREIYIKKTDSEKKKDNDKERNRKM